MATTGVLTFEEYPDDEFRVRLSPVSMGAWLDFSAEWGTAAPYAAFRKRIDRFVALAQPEWTRNAPDLQVDAFTDLDYALVKGIVALWIERVNEVASPLPAGSFDTERSPERETPEPANRSARRRNSRERKGSTPSSAGIRATP